MSTACKNDGVAAPALVLTLELEPTAFAHFEALRRQHFPPRRNQVPAHLTLFHKLPGEHESEIARMLAALCVQQPLLHLQVEKIVLLGRGVAYRINADVLHQLHGTLASAWNLWLTPQDRQGFRPHVVVQNKVEPAVARALYTELSAGFRPFTINAIGLHLWRYLGGPWASLTVLPFSGI